MDLFNFAGSGNYQTLSEKLRPKNLSDFIGPSKILGVDSPLIKSLQEGRISNMILWGPPGTGKTSFARLIPLLVDVEFIVIHAVEVSTKRLREIGKESRDRRIQFRRRTVLFIDEIHRLNKGQQDVLLPFTEEGDVILVGATTENPSYELNSALLSRCRVIIFDKHSEANLLSLLGGACKSEQVNLNDLLSDEAQLEICRMAKGDARQLFNLFDQVLQHYKGRRSDVSLPEKKSNGLSLEPFHWPLKLSDFLELVEGTLIYYDKTGDEHYNCISAFIKSVRGSDPDAALYYLARMIRGGESPVFIARRLIILASEDIGNGDPKALSVAVSGLQAVEAIGLPEGGITLAQVTTYLSCAPKSNRSYVAYKKALGIVDEYGALPIPKSLRSSRTSLSRSLGYGRGYKYSHDSPRGWIEQDFLPDKIKGQKFYEPLYRGFEKTVNDYLAWLKEATKEEATKEEGKEAKEEGRET